MTFLELQTLVIQKLAENSTPAYWGLDEIKANINRGCREFARRTEFKNSTATLTASTVYHILPTDLLIPKAVYVTGSKLDQTSADFLDSIDPTWQATTGTATKWLFYNGMVRIYPTPTPTPVVTMRYVPTLATLTNNTDVPDFPAGHHEAAAYWAIFECFNREGKGQDKDKAAGYLELFKAVIEDFKASFNQWSLLGGGDTGTTFLSMIHKVQSALAESPNPQKWTLDEIKINLNRGVREFSRQTEFKVTTASLVASGSGYSLPASLLAPKAVYIGGSKIDQTTSEYLDGINPAWRSETGTPVKWCFDEGIVRLWPNATSAVTMRYVASPAALSAHSDICEIPTGFHDAPVFWAIAECLGREDQAKAGSYFELFKKLVGDYKASVGQWTLASQEDAGNTFKALIARVFAKLSETPTPQQFSIEDVKASINRGVREFARRTEFKVSTATLAASGSDYALPSGMMTPKALYANGSKLDFVQPEYLDGVSPAWRSATGTPTKWLFDNGLVRLYPRPTLSTSVEMRYVPLPASLSAAADVPGIQTEYIDAVWQWACFELLAKSGDPAAAAKAPVFQQLFNDLVGAFRGAHDLSQFVSNGEADSSFGAMIYRVNRSVKKFGPVSLDEIKSSINNGYRQFVQMTRCYTKKENLVGNGDGSFQLPSDVYFPKEVYYQGSQILEARFIPENYDDDDTPVWIKREGKIMLYPTPDVDYTTFVPETFTGTILAGNKTMTLTSSIEMDSSKILVTLGGFAQQTTDFEILSPRKVSLLSAVLGDADYEVKTVPFSEEGTITSGKQIQLADNVNYPDLVELYLGGILQTYGTDYSFPSPDVIELDANVGGATPWKLVLLYESSLSMLYVPCPPILDTASDIPEMVPDGYREAMVYWAISELLEGNKAGVGALAVAVSKFNGLVSEYKQAFGPPVQAFRMPFSI